MLSYGFLKKIMVAFTQFLFPFKLIGKEKVRDGAAVLVGNHYRIWDIVHMACTTKEKVHFITKKELYKSKFLAYLCNKVEAIPVSRDGNDAAAIMTALRYLKKRGKDIHVPGRDEEPDRCGTSAAERRRGAVCDQSARSRVPRHVPA